MPLTGTAKVMRVGIGCVFGVRDAAANWSFYLQENVRVGYTRAPSGIPPVQWANRTLRLSRIFPNEVMVFTNTVPKPLP